MATTESRTGFRLPWSADRAESDGSTSPDQTTDPTNATDATDATDAPAPTDVDAASGEPTATADGATDGGASSYAEPTVMTTDQLTAVSTPAEPVAAASSTMSPALPPRKPSKFLADLTKAMQAAAESAREATLSQFQGDAKGFIEQIHGRSATEATDLRQQADDDVAAIREWSKAEIARIREETDERIAARKARLEAEVEDHAALIEREIDRVQRKVGEFEAEMDRFFEHLLAETDPTRFAAMAENLPEAPTFDASALTPADAPTEQPASAAATDGPTDVTAESASVADGAATEAGAVEASDTETPTETQEDREAAFAAIQAAAEAAEVAEAQATSAEPTAEQTAEPSESAGDTSNGDASDGDMSTVETATEDIDPRLGALGLTPDFAAAEAEALAAADGSSDEEIPDIAEDALAARLAGLTPGSHDAADGAVETEITRVAVVGLVSVASIAGFKRHLGRVPGVRAVGVSSGPDGEFVFAVTHDPSVTLGDVIPTLQGFQARVTGTGDGVVNVAASDPESEG